MIDRDSRRHRFNIHVPAPCDRDRGVTNRDKISNNGSPGSLDVDPLHVERFDGLPREDWDSDSKREDRDCRSAASSDYLALRAAV